MELTLVEGEVWWAEPSPAVGREQGGRRPVVVVSGQLFHDTVTTLALVVPATSRDRAWPNHVVLEGSAGVDGWAMTEQVRAISRERLVRRAGIVTPECLADLRAWVVDYLR